MLINNKYKSKNKKSRNNYQIEYLVLHYTSVPLSSTLGIFTNDYSLIEKDRAVYEGINIDLLSLSKRQVSSHYVLAEDGKIYCTVDESEAAFHAGVSSWGKITNLNSRSIGIEIVNVGFNWLSSFDHNRSMIVDGDKRQWCRFTIAQLDSLIPLCLKIISKYNILPENVVGHSDIAPGRKFDPGPAFFWEELANSGIGAWYNTLESTINEKNLPKDCREWMKNKLSFYGYNVNSKNLIDVIRAFQMHFRPNNIDGLIDLESMQVVDSLCMRKQNNTDIISWQDAIR